VLYSSACMHDSYILAIWQSKYTDILS